MKTTNNYYKPDGSISHTRIGDWEITDLHCLHCGEKGFLWVEEYGDYYAGETHICLSCGHYFSLSGGPCDGNKDDQQSQVLEQLRKQDEN